MKPINLIILVLTLAVIVGPFVGPTPEAAANTCDANCLLSSCSASDPVYRCTCECTWYGASRCSCESQSSGGGGGKDIPHEDLGF